MKATCYWCSKEIIGTVKRCSRCRLTTYCSKSCQAASWKAGHRSNCSPHDSLAHGLPEKGSEEWHALELDKILSRWMEHWRSVFQHFAVMSLNLPNHGPERVATHCMVAWVRPNFMHEDRIRDYWIEKASVETTDWVAREFPNLKGLVSPRTPYTPKAPFDPGTSPSDPDPEDTNEDSWYDPTRVRFVLILHNTEGEVKRVRCLLWNDLNIPRLRALPKKTGNDLAKDWDMILMYTIERMHPREVEAKFGALRQTTQSQYE